MIVAFALSAGESSAQENDFTSDGRLLRAANAALKRVYEMKGEGDPSTNGFLDGQTTIRSYYRYGPFKLTFFVASNDRNMVIAFRGTDGSLPMHENEMMNGRWPNENDIVDTGVLGHQKASNLFKIFGVPILTASGLEGVMVHPGWAFGVASLYEELKAEMTRQNSAQKNLIITGHSMGGALAGYTTLRLMKDNLINSVPIAKGVSTHRLVTFNAPRYAGALHGGGAGLKSSFDSLAKQKNLLAYSFEVEGDTTPNDWLDKVKHIRVDRLGFEVKLVTDPPNSHGADECFAAFQKAMLVQDRVRVLRVYCHTTSESGEDEVYVSLVGTGVRYPASGAHDINDGKRPISNWAINNQGGDAVKFTNDTMTIELWEEDSGADPDDPLGSVTVRRTDKKFEPVEVKMTGDGGDYSLFYQIE